MTRIECAHEADVLAAVCTGQWPRRVDAELCDHVATCDICTDVVAVASALEDDAAASRHAVQLPESGAVWWRAQLRARDEALRTAVRPITMTQALAFACVVGLGGAFFGATSAWFQAFAGWLGGFWSRIDLHAITAPAALGATLASHGVLVATVASFLVLGPLAVYLVLRED